MRRRYSEDDLRYIEKHANLGTSIKEIADKFGVTITAIHHVLSRNNIKFCRKPIFPIMGEIWLNCFGVPDIIVSSLGRIARYSTKSIITGWIGRDGYVLVDLSGIGSFYSHRLIAQTFIINPFNKPEVNHINGIKLDNRVSNLEWVTRSENMVHAYQTGLSVSVSGFEHHRTALTKEQVEYCFELRKNGKTYKEIGDIMGLHYKTISRHLNNRRNTERSETIP